MESVLSTYTVSLESPLLEGPFVADVTASSQAAAIRRVQYSAFHLYQAVEMLHAECSILEVATVAQHRNDKADCHV